MRIRNKEIKFRKWKVKDKKDFVNLINNDGTEKEIADVLVYSCLENPNIALTADEYRYVIGQIRKESLGAKIDFNFKCSACDENFVQAISIDEILKPVYSDYQTIKKDGTTIEIGDIVNKTYYDAAIDKCESTEEEYFVDFLYHIHSINGNSAFTYDELVKIVEDLDMAVFDGILDEWDKQRFKIDDNVDVSCTSCGAVETYTFDEIPGFFPETWFNR